MYYGNITLKTKNLPSETSNHSSPVQNSLRLFGKPYCLTSMSTSAKSMPFGSEMQQMKKSFINLGSSSSLSTKSRQRILSYPRDPGCQHMNSMQMLSNLPTHTKWKNWPDTENTCSNSSTQSALGNKGMSFSSIKPSEPHSPMMSDGPWMMSTHATLSSSPWLEGWELNHDLVDSKCQGEQVEGPQRSAIISMLGKSMSDAPSCTSEKGARETIKGLTVSNQMKKQCVRIEDWRSMAWNP